MPSDEAGGQPQEGWTPEQKGRGAATGEADPKAKASDDRAATEAAAMKIEQDKEKSEGQPS